MNWKKCSCLCQANVGINLLRGFRKKQGLSFWNEAIFRRSFNTASINSNGINIFDRKTKVHQKDVAARYPDQHVYDYIKMEVLFIFYFKPGICPHFML